MPQSVARVGRSFVDEQRWWVQLSGTTKFESFAAVDDMPDYIKERLAVLLISPVGFRDDNIGRRITEDAFWIFY